MNKVKLPDLSIGNPQILSRGLESKTDKISTYTNSSGITLVTQYWVRVDENPAVAGSRAMCNSSTIYIYQMDYEGKVSKRDSILNRVIAKEFGPRIEVLQLFSMKDKPYFLYNTHPENAKLQAEHKK